MQFAATAFLKTHPKLKDLTPHLAVAAVSARIFIWTAGSPSKIKHLNLNVKPKLHHIPLFHHIIFTSVRINPALFTAFSEPNLTKSSYLQTSAAINPR